MAPEENDWKKSPVGGSEPAGRPDAERITGVQRQARHFGPPPWESAGAAAGPRGGFGSFIVDPEGTILAFDRNMERLTGWDAFEVVGRSKDLGLYGEPDGQGLRTFQPRPLFEGRLPRTDRTRSVRLAIARKDGARIEAEALVTPLGGRTDRISVEIQRVVSRTQVAAAPSARTDRDPLTGVPRAPEFFDRLRGHFEEARIVGQPLSRLLGDVDHLELINGRCGREAGDLVLRHVAGILVASIRQSDIVARIENDDFAVLLSGTGRSDARHVGGRIRKAIEAFSFAGTTGHDDLEVTVSIGIACFPADAEGPGELLRRSGEALAEVRRLGRNRVWCYVRRPRVPVGVPVYFDGPAAHVLGTSRDLSNSGMFIETGDNELPTGMRLGLAFRLPGQDAPVRVVGRVIRRVDRPGEVPRGLGIEFERYADDDRRRLESFLVDSLGQAPGIDDDRG